MEIGAPKAFWAHTPTCESWEREARFFWECLPAPTNRNKDRRANQSIDDDDVDDDDGDDDNDDENGFMSHHIISCQGERSRLRRPAGTQC